VPNFFHVKVLERSGTDVKLDLRIISAERTEFDDGAAFALMLLYDPISQQLVYDAPLANRMSQEDTMDREWLERHLDDYVEDGILTDVNNLPMTVDFEKMSTKEMKAFFRSSRAPTALLDVTTTSPEWAGHLRPGMEWDSAAFDPFT
jgi:hypothetical protein